MTRELTFKAVRAHQSDRHVVLSFAARASEVLEIADIDRIRRDNAGDLKGFQRPQITSHIHEIRDYLRQDDAVLPNPIVVAFIEGAEIVSEADDVVTLRVKVEDQPPGFVVDGQQRLTALSGLPDKNFQVFVSALVCRSEEELRKQFILINNTRPLPKSLIYELLPGVQGLPERVSSRTVAAKLTEALNYQEGSSLHNEIKQHTNPSGRISDTAVQKLFLNSLSDGACRTLIKDADGYGRCCDLVSEFFFAVRSVFAPAWDGHTAKTSRLIHGAGIVAMGYVMELLWAREGAADRDAFRRGLEHLVGKTAWTRGEWILSEGERRPWNSIQNVHRDIQMLASLLTRIVKNESNPAGMVN